MVSSPLLFHIGYHKTATTWLQHFVFQKENGFPQILSHAEIFAGIINPHGLFFDPSRARNLIGSRRGALKAGTVDVASLEALSGNPFHGGRESDDYARRLKEIAPDAKILVTIREQVRLMASVYMQYLLRGGTEPAQRFFSGDAVGGYFRFDAAHFEYHRLVALYQDLFGTENVLVLPLETISADQDQAVRVLTEFCGNTQLKNWVTRNPRGVSYPERAAPVLRRINHFRNGPMNPYPAIDLGPVSDFLYRAAGGGLRRLVRKPGRPVTALAQARFGGRFDDSNQQLAKIITHPVDLSSYQGLVPKRPPLP